MSPAPGLLEVHERLAQVGLATDATFHMPLTQDTISDVIGLSGVHLNRTLQTLRRDGLIVSRQGYITLTDRRRLVEIAAYVSRFPLAWQPSVGSETGRRASSQLAMSSWAVPSQLKSGPVRSATRRAAMTSL
ncbi:Crp/Fnr family transcriptional regulator [uncultured Phenylobacterium sp.]|uniref:Crp/Fnr family transcriptional regulator n=1 Tax=uncultured Phenylobacterium sp. TaxID=349273 RepID=UPI0025E63278|nr:helix-turn-helix domain-containing protein [uncultured Phenylobacterium sp.]